MGALGGGLSVGLKAPFGTAVRSIPGSSLVAVKAWGWWRFEGGGTRRVWYLFSLEPGCRMDGDEMGNSLVEIACGVGRLAGWEALQMSRGGPCCSENSG